ncbi:lipid IV(A) 3-deoxy-D-manno-octulosonic acid transferase [Noviluteimonas gilva]|uniref:3-deoxy-D-manno-octulosonic acid transferase n=1 Tax=Noviluteimonas gilva TaxID=2682097 RepID=A0A7C9LH27_9GAMM|nr:lipid IV(A) 3-deoxy-D-manno-octulosonic acid transferase [Lysobacter gilvus]MUV12779.1 3-deoxy-D-manno-octulosonic acid transferase [Lysobacter gilvus]
MRKDPIERLLRGLYSVALYVLLPVTAYHLIWRGFRQRAYFRRWNERYAAYRGLHDDDAPRDTLWVHAVSVGEVNAAAPVVNALRKLHPHLPLLVTTITPTGSARVRALWGDSVQHVYLPYDVPGAVRRFFEHFRPRAGLILETELWPNLLFGARDHGVPTYLLNGRLSERSLRGYRVLAPIVGRALRTVRRVGAQSEADGQRFIALGAKPDQVLDLGNLKFDTPVPEGLDDFLVQFRAQAGDRPVWIAASTHEGEEADVIALHRRLREKHPGLLLLWAPRHPERFRAAVDHAHAAGWRVATRRLTRWPGPGDDVFVVDTLGELMAFYACAQVAFVGGSLQAIGGHNLLEPAAVGTAIVTGPHLHNFADIARRLEQAQAVRIAQDVEGVFADVDALLGDETARQQMVEAGLRLVQEGRGALARSFEMIAPVLPRGAR